MKQKILALIIVIVCILAARPSIASVGDWKAFRNVGTYDQVALLGEKLYVLTDGNIFVTDTTLTDFTSLSRLSLLSGNTISKIAVSPDHQKLALLYNDGLIDIIEAEGNTISIMDLQTKSLTANKQPLGVTFQGDEMIVAAEFGFYRVSLSSYSIVDSYTTPSSCNVAFYWKDAWYRSVRDHGLQRCPSTNNAKQESNWETLQSDTILAALTFFTPDSTEHCWVIANDKNVNVLDADGKTLRRSSRGCYNSLIQAGPYIFMQGSGFTLADPRTYDISVCHDDHVGRSSSICALTDDTFFSSATSVGLFCFQLTAFNQWAPFNYELLADGVTIGEVLGSTAFYSGLLLGSGKFVATNSKRMCLTNYSAMARTMGDISIYNPDDDTWTTQGYRDIIAQGKEQGLDVFQGISAFAADPNMTDTYFISTLQRGLFHFVGHALYEWFPQSAPEEFPDQATSRITAVYPDGKGYVWVGCPFTDYPLRSLSLDDGKWRCYPISGFPATSNIHRILEAKHDSYGLKWLLCDYPYQSSKVAMYYDHATPATLSDDQSAYFSILVDQDNNQYSTINYFFDIVEDLKGSIWLLTSIGPLVIDDPYTTFTYAQNNPGYGKVRRVKVPRNDGTNLADYLMESASCTCMAIDNLNRKWIGTLGSGLFLLSEDCITEISHFDTSNSPLFSNDILSLTFDPETSLLYVSCESGILTYQTDAWQGEEDFNNLYCYPNPVRPEYNGDLRIMGLMANSQVTITDVTGNLIMRTLSIGSSITWDLRDSDGRRIEPGIYMIHGVDEAGTKGKICKFLVL
jgi:hypothetical protein